MRIIDIINFIPENESILSRKLGIKRFLVIGRDLNKSGASKDIVFPSNPEGVVSAVRNGISFIVYPYRLPAKVLEGSKDSFSTFLFPVSSLFEGEEDLWKKISRSKRVFLEFRKRGICPKIVTLAACEYDLLSSMQLLSLAGLINQLNPKECVIYDY
ncbi:MAG: hypothetical protein QXL16_01415 [Candidatus Micrarchaeaceae archaeon]